MRGSRVASQAETINFIQSNFACEDLGDNFLKLVFSTDEAGRSQIIWAQVKEAVMCVSSPFARTSDITADQALNVNTSVFGVDKYADFFVLVHNVPLPDLDASEVNVAFAMLAKWADDLEKALGLGDRL
jgi:hypothetical protein